MYTFQNLNIEVKNNWGIISHAILNTMKKHNVNSNAFAIDIINLASTELFDSKGNIVEIDC